MSIVTVSTIDYTYGNRLPVPVVSLLLAGREKVTTHGRLVDNPTRATSRTWCGKTLTASHRTWIGAADVVAAVDCRSCRRSRPASWNWRTS